MQNSKGWFVFSKCPEMPEVTWIPYYVDRNQSLVLLLQLHHLHLLALLILLHYRLSPQASVGTQPLVGHRTDMHALRARGVQRAAGNRS